MEKEEIKFLGVDWGEKRIGLALGDSVTKTATPFKVVGNINEVIKVVKEEGANEIIVGKPIKMTKIKAQMPNEYNEFINLLKNKLEIPIKTIDERLSSKAADALEGSKKIKAPRDAVAAMLILQTYIDNL